MPRLFSLSLCWNEGSGTEGEQRKLEMHMQLLLRQGNVEKNRGKKKKQGLEKQRLDSGGRLQDVEVD